MKKDIAWAKKEIKELMTEKSQNYPHDEMIEKEIVLGILNQLEPKQDQREQLEVAYKDILERGEFWFDDKKYVVVEKRTVEEDWVMEWLDNNDFYDHRTAETVLANAVDKGELGYYGTKYSVVKKEPETVADVLTTFWKSSERLKEVMNMEVEELEEC